MADETKIQQALSCFTPGPLTPSDNVLTGANAMRALYEYLEGVNHVHTRHGTVYASAIYDLMRDAETALRESSCPS
jgi:hypothetical protein